MAYPHQLEGFIGKYLVNRGAEIANPAYAILEAVVDKQAGHELKAEYVKLAFDYDAAQEHPDAQYVTYSSKILETLVELAVNDHSTAIRYCPAQERQPASLEERAALFLNATTRHINVVEPPKAYFAPCLRFKFKLAYLCDEREEDLHHIWIDGHNGRQLTPEWGVSHIFYSGAADCLRPELPLMPLTVLFSKALQVLDSSGHRLMSKLESRTTQQRDADLERTGAYFGGMIEDMKIKLSKAKFAKDDTQEKLITDKLNAIMVQKQHHIKDIEEKYKVRCEAGLLDVVLYMVPRWRVVIQTAATRGQSGTTETILWWDEILKCLLY